MKRKKLVIGSRVSKLALIYAERVKDKIRYKPHKISWVNCNAEKLPFKDNTFDKYIISFCLRNITFIDSALNEAIRVLKPGGIFYCLEFSKPKSSLVNL